MKNQQVKNTKLHFPAERWFWVFLIVHVVAWTLTASLVRLNLPLDSLEGAAWGQHLQWGYDKNPFLNGWLTALAIYLGNYSDWTIYLFSQLSVGVALSAVWALGKRIMPASYALASVLLLEGMQYFNFHAIDFNDNTLELGIWALATYTFYLAIRQRTLTAWLATGVLLALGMSAKYYTLALVATFGLFLLRSPHRKQLATLPPYLALLVFVIMQVPHALWLPQHEYITITYMFDRTNSAALWINHLYFPLQFMWQQIEVFIPSLVFFCLLFLGKKPRTEALHVKQDDKMFVLYMALGPFVLTALLALALGIKLRAGWGMPILTFWTLCCMVWLTPRLSRTKLYALIIGMGIFMAAAITGISVSFSNSKDTSSANYPGKHIATVLTAYWETRYHTPLRYVAGPRFTADNISYYSPHHPAVWMEWNSVHAPWIDVNDLKKHGAIFVWDISDNETMPAEIAKQFPNLTKTVVMEFAWQRNKHGLPPVKLGVALLPPESAKTEN